MPPAGESKDPVSEFVDQSLWHGPLDRAEAIRSAHHDLAARSIYAAAVLGDDAAVRAFIAREPSSATAQGGPRGWSALTYLCFSKYLQRDRSASPRFVAAARALLDAGASPNSGFFDESHQPNPEWESVLYGAAGVAHDAELTRLLVDRGAEVNDAEVPYHTPETYDNGAMRVLVESGKLSKESLTTMLLRKSDWHDLEGIRLLLDYGVDPNDPGRWRHNALQHAVLSDNRADIVELLLDRGADPTLVATEKPWPPRRGRGDTAIAMAAWAGRGDLLAMFEARGYSIDLPGLDGLAAAYARADAAAIAHLGGEQPALARELVAQGASVLVPFARNGNGDGLRLLLDDGIPVDSRLAEDNGYFGDAKGATALIVAAWHAEHDLVKLLIDRGADVNAVDDRGRTALQLAVLACVDSYWTVRRSPESVAALLAAGASVKGVKYPSGYDEADQLLAQYGAST